jgi:hypothetical protein
MKNNENAGNTENDVRGILKNKSLHFQWIVPIKIRANSRHPYQHATDDTSTN